jgi:hypothetical protein
MNQELRNDLIASWNELEEAVASFEQLSPEEVIENLDAIKDRVIKAKHWLDKYVTEEDIIKDL